MELTSNKHQRQSDDERDQFAKTVVLFFLILGLVWIVTGCATLNDHVAACYDAGGRPSYSQGAGLSGAVKFDCK